MPSAAAAAASSRPPAGEEQPGDRPELPTEDAGAAAGAGADGAPGHAGAAHRQVRVHRGGHVSHHARYVPSLRRVAARPGISRSPLPLLFASLISFIPPYIFPIHHALARLYLD